MKSYLTADEYRRMVHALAQYFDDLSPTNQFVLSAFPKRLVPLSPQEQG